MSDSKTQNPGRRNVSPGILPKALRKNEKYKKARKARIVARKGLKTAVDTLRTARKQIKDHQNYVSMDSAARKSYPPSDKLSPKQLQDAHTTIDEWQQTAKDEHDRFAAAHEDMRDIEKGIRPKIKLAHRLARTTLTGVGASGLDGIRAPGTMYGKHGINNLGALFGGESDKMEDVKVWGPSYQGGRRKKTRKKRRRKNKRKTKRRKKTRRRKKRRKKRRTKRR